MQKQAPGWHHFFVLLVFFVLLFFITFFMGWMFVRIGLLPLFLGFVINICACLALGSFLFFWKQKTRNRPLQAIYLLLFIMLAGTFISSVLGYLTHKDWPPTDGTEKIATLLASEQSAIESAYFFTYWNHDLYRFKTTPEVISSFVLNKDLKMLDSNGNKQLPSNFPMDMPPWWWQPEHLSTPSHFFKQKPECFLQLLYSQKSHWAYLVDCKF